jgi:hypothetical protein
MNLTQLLDGKGNLTDTYRSCLEEHKVSINGEEFYLIKTFYGTNTRQDFLTTFSASLDADLLAKASIIPDQLTYNEYAILYDTSLQVVAVFNMKFAHYDFSQHKILFRSPEDILLEFYKAPPSPPKSVAEELHAKLAACQDKVHTHIAAQTPPSEEPYTPTFVKIDQLQEELQDEFAKRNLLDKEKRPKRRDFMEHAVMYAAAAPLNVK